MGMSNFTYTLKGATALEWLVDVDVPPLESHSIIWEKLSIIVLLCFSRASSSNILIGSLSPSSFFFPPWAFVGVCKADLT